jgi:MFS family permease
MVKVASSTRPLLAAVLSATLSILPVQLLGASAVLAREELHFDPADLGLAIAAFFTAYGVSAWTAGQVSQTRGPRVGLVIGATLSCVALLGIATVVHDRLTMLAFIMVAGVGNAFAQIGGNLALAAGGSMRRPGLAFALKQSAVPVSSLLAGAAVPIIGVTFGWRWSFVAALVLAPILYGLLVQRFAEGTSLRDDDRAPATDWSMMIPVALAYGGAAGAAAVLSTFLVESAVRSGLSIAGAGSMLVMGSIISIVTRLGIGMLVDRRGHADYMIIAVMLFVGTAGYLALAQGSIAMLAIGTVVAFSAGWGWNGAFNHAIVNMNRRNPGTASSLAMMGMALGGVLWPIAFGLLVTHLSFRVAWSATGVLSMTSAILLAVTANKIKARAASAQASS